MLGEIFYLGSIFCAFLTIYILLFKENALKSYADYLLSVYFFLQIWCVGVYLLIFSGWIIFVPHLYKSAAPINFLLPPLSYIYVRVVLFNEKKFNYKDIFHFVPFLLFFLNYVPFYILATDQKRSIVEAASNNFAHTYQYNAGFIPEYVSAIIRPIQILVYVIFQWLIIIKYKRTNKSLQVQKQIFNVVKWLKIFSWATTLFFLSFLILVILALTSANLESFSVYNIVPDIVISLSFFVISFYLLIHPEVLTGLPFIKYQEIASEIIDNTSNKIPFITDDYHIEIEALDTYFTSKQPYLISNLTISQVAVILDIPVRELSYIINNHYGMRFTDYLNSFRIKHIVENFNTIALNTYTLESIAKQSGFSSKSSFYRAFHKIYNCTPLEYIDKNKKFPDN